MTTYTAERVVVTLLNLRAQVACGLTSIDEPDRPGADSALTMAIEDWRALIEPETLTPRATCATMDTSLESDKGAV